MSAKQDFDGDIGTLADMLSTPHEIEHGGKVYKITAPTQDQQGRYQRWLEDKALDAIERGGFRSEEARASAYAAWTRDCASGLYEFGNDAFNKALGTISGGTKLIEIICDVTPEVAKELFETRRKRIDAIFQAAVTNDPKALALALKALGLPSEIFLGVSATRRSTKRKRKSRR